MSRCTNRFLRADRGAFRFPWRLGAMALVLGPAGRNGAANLGTVLVGQADGNAYPSYFGATATPERQPGFGLDDACAHQSGRVQAALAGAVKTWHDKEEVPDGN